MGAPSPARWPTSMTAIFALKVDGIQQVCDHRSRSGRESTEAVTRSPVTTPSNSGWRSPWYLHQRISIAVDGRTTDLSHLQQIVDQSIHVLHAVQNSVEMRPGIRLHLRTILFTQDRGKSADGKAHANRVKQNRRTLLSPHSRALSWAVRLFKRAQAIVGFSSVYLFLNLRQHVIERRDQNRDLHCVRRLWAPGPNNSSRSRHTWAVSARRTIGSAIERRVDDDIHILASSDSRTRGENEGEVSFAECMAPKSDRRYTATGFPES